MSFLTKSRDNALERVTGGHAVITTDHALIHEGVAFTAAGVMTINTGKVGAIFISVPAATYVHFNAAMISANTALTVSLMEQYTKAPGDIPSALTPMNRNRISAITSALTITAGPDVTPTSAAGAATLATVGVGANQDSKKVGGAATSAHEWVLKPGYAYCLAITNASGSTSTVSYDLFWYEEGGA